MPTITTAHFLFQVTLTPSGSYLGLTVPGLAEGRPRLVIGDKVIICRSGQLRVLEVGVL